MNGDINRPVGTSVVCYFCNQAIGNGKLLQSHVTQCGSILEKCQQECGAWTERRHRSMHNRQCPRNATIQRSAAGTLPSRASLGAQIYNTLEDKAREAQYQTTIENIEYIKRELATIRIVLQEEREINVQLKNEIDQMRRQYILSEERNQIVVATMTAMRRTNDEELSKQKHLLSELHENINKINMQNQECSDYVIQMELQLSSLKQIVEHEQNERAQLELVLNNQDGKLRSFSKFETDLEELKNTQIQETSLISEKNLTIQNELHELKNMHARETQTVREELQNIHSFQNDIDKNTKSTSDLISKFELIDFEIKALKIIVEEHSSSIGTTEKNTDTLSKTVYDLQESGNVVVVKQDELSIPSKIADTTGHLIWRIDAYQHKLKDAKDKDTVLKSSMFLSHRYGYTLQAEVNLNGMGKWKGRHLTASVYILPGEFDPILEWPATLQVNIILKDQTPKRTQSMDIIKTLVVRSKDSHDNISKSMNALDQNSTDIKRRYIFIPHTSLDKFDYTKNNTMFFEIVIKNN